MNFATPTLAFFQCQDGLFVSRANDGITFPVPHLLAILNWAEFIADRATVVNLSAPVTSAQIPFTSGFLASHVRV
jgi:hypothetical protein